MCSLSDDYWHNIVLLMFYHHPSPVRVDFLWLIGILPIFLTDWNITNIPDWLEYNQYSWLIGILPIFLTNWNITNIPDWLPIDPGVVSSAVYILLHTLILWELWLLVCQISIMDVNKIKVFNWLEIRNMDTTPVWIKYTSYMELFLVLVTRRYGGLRPPTSSSCGGLRGPFGPPVMWGNLF